MKLEEHLQTLIPCCETIKEELKKERQDLEGEKKLDEQPPTSQITTGKNVRRCSSSFIVLFVADISGSKWIKRGSGGGGIHLSVSQ